MVSPVREEDLSVLFVSCRGAAVALGARSDGDGSEKDMDGIGTPYQLAPHDVPHTLYPIPVTTPLPIPCTTATP